MARRCGKPYKVKHDRVAVRDVVRDREGNLGVVTKTEAWLKVAEVVTGPQQVRWESWLNLTTVVADPQELLEFALNVGVSPEDAVPNADYEQYVQADAVVLTRQRWTGVKR